MNKDHFLQQDLHKAYAEGVCIIDCMLLMRRGFLTEDYGTAKIAAENIARSFAELERLNNRKKENDSLKELLSKLPEKNIAFELIKECVYE